MSVSTYRPLAEQGGADLTEVEQIKWKVLSENPGTVLVEQGENYLKFRLPDGQYKVVSSIGRLFTEDGLEIDTTLKPVNSGLDYILAVAADSIRPHLPLISDMENSWGESDSGWIAQTGPGLDYALKVRGDGTRRFFPQKNNTNEYIEIGRPQYYDNSVWRDLVLGNASIKDNNVIWDEANYELAVFASKIGSPLTLTLKDDTYAAPIRWKIDLNGINWDESILITEDTGEQVGFMESPTWTDSSKSLEPHEVSWTYTDGYLILTPDLTGAVFPVVLDPNYSITAGANDGYTENAALVGGNHLYIGTSGGSWYKHTWLHFNNVTVDQGSTVTAATVTFKTTSYGSGTGQTVETAIWCLNEDNSAPPADYAAWQTDETLHDGAAKTDWDFANTTTAGVTLVSADFSAHAQNVFARTGWASGNALGVHIDNDGATSDRVQGVQSYDGTDYTEPVLSITFTPPASSYPTIVVGETTSTGTTITPNLGSPSTDDYIGVVVTTAAYWSATGKSISGIAAPAGEGWTEIKDQGSGTNTRYINRTAIYWKKWGVGGQTDDTTPTFTTTMTASPSAVRAASSWAKVTGATDIVTGTVSASTTFGTNPPSVSTGAGSQDLLALVLSGAGGQVGPTALTSGPSGYTSDAQINGTTYARSATLSAYKTVAGSSEDPGAITWTGTATYAAYAGATFLFWLTPATPGVTVTQSGGTTVVAEGGATDSYTVVLDALPTDDVTVPVTETDAQFNVDKSSLTFTTSNWDTPQTVTVTAVNDSIDEDDYSSGTITHTPVTGATEYAGISVASVTPTVQDNDTAGVTVTEYGGTTVVTEGSEEIETYTIVLNTKPTFSVTVPVTDDTQVDTDRYPSIVFTDQDWNTPQTVTVTATNDSVDEDDHNGTITHTDVTSSDPKYAGISVNSVVATVHDNDTAGVSTTQAYFDGSGDQAYSNYSTAITGDLDLRAKVRATDWTPAADRYIITHYGNDGNRAWRTLLHTGGTIRFVYTTDGSTLVTKASTVALGTTAGLTDNESDIWVRFTLDVNNGASGHDVKFYYSSDGTNWTQLGTTVTTAGTISTYNSNAVMCVGDNAATGTSSWDGRIYEAQIFNGINGTLVANPSFDASPWDIGETVNNDPQGRTWTLTGATIQPRGGALEVTEGGTTDTYNVVLKTQPTASVNVNVSNSDEQATSTPSLLTFTTGNWVTPQTVTVTAVDDLAVEGDHTGTLTHYVSSSPGDAKYHTISASSVVATVHDNDVVAGGITVTESSGTTEVTEGYETTDTYTIVLDTQPTADVTVPVTDDSQVDTDKYPSIVFTTGNWATPQTVTVTATNDSVDEDDHNGTITHTGVTSSDLNYNGISVNSVVATIHDNDTAGVTVTAATYSVAASGDDGSRHNTEFYTSSTVVGVGRQGGSNPLNSWFRFDGIVAEKGTTCSSASILGVGKTGENAPSVQSDLYGVDEDDSAAPTSDSEWQTDHGLHTTATVPFDFTRAGYNEMQVTPNLASILDEIFARTNWVSGNAVQIHWDGVSTDGLGNVGLASYDHLYDDPPMLSLNCSGMIEVTEGGATDTYTVVLNSKPTADVIVSVTESDAQFNVNKSSLTFTTSNWSTPQTVTASAVDDANMEDVYSGTVTHTPVTSSDSKYSGISVSSATVTVNDNDESTVDAYHILSSGDDAMDEYDTNWFVNDYDVVNLGKPVLPYCGLFRFVPDIPPTATITDANLQVVSEDTRSGAVNLKIYGVKHELDHIAPTSNAEFDTDTTMRTIAAVDWDISATQWVAGNSYQSADFTSVIQELIDQSGYQQGDALGLQVCDDGTTAGNWRWAASWDHTTYTEPILNVSYVSSGASFAGSLESATFDTGASDGFIINSVTWSGSEASNSTVSFQIAVFSDPNGSIVFKGPNGSEVLRYEAAGVGIPVTVDSTYHHPYETGYRYFRYKIFIDNASGGAGPVVDDLIINWSP